MDFLVHLDDLAVVRISGEDAAGFLHTQLSNDIAGMGPDDARLAAYCNPKGRMLGSLVLWRESPDAAAPLLALVKADLLEPLLKRLRMFVLRAKVRFDIAELEAWGASTAAHPPAGAWRVERREAFTLVSAPAAPGGPMRHWVIAAAGTDAAALAGKLGLPPEDGGRAWHAQDVEAGLGWVEQANAELFIPQSLNYDLVGGVSFTKGCYPGQEIVARAHFRGTVKRRGVPGRCPASDAVLQAGADIFDANRPGSPAGRIINAALIGDTGERAGGWRLFMEVGLADIGRADFRAVSPEGPVISLLPPPYPLEVQEG